MHSTASLDRGAAARAGRSPGQPDHRRPEAGRWSTTWLRPVDNPELPQIAQYPARRHRLPGDAGRRDARLRRHRGARRSRQRSHPTAPAPQKASVAPCATIPSPPALTAAPRHPCSPAAASPARRWSRAPVPRRQPRGPARDHPPAARDRGSVPGSSSRPSGTFRSPDACTFRACPVKTRTGASWQPGTAGCPRFPGTEMPALQAPPLWQDVEAPPAAGLLPIKSPDEARHHDHLRHEHPSRRHPQKSKI